MLTGSMIAMLIGLAIVLAAVVGTFRFAEGGTGAGLDGAAEAAAAQIAAADASAAQAGGGGKSSDGGSSASVTDKAAGAAAAGAGGKAMGADDVAGLLAKVGLRVQQTAEGTTLVRDVTVNKQTRVVTLDELSNAFTKAAGADEKFRQADELRKQTLAQASQYQESMTVLENLKTMRDESKPAAERIAAMQKVAVQLGENPADAENAAKQMLAQAAANAANAAAGENGAAADKAKAPLKLEDLPPEFQNAIKRSQKQESDELRDKIYAAVNDSVAGDPILRKLDKEALDEVKELARREVRARVVIDGEQPNADLFVDVIQRMRRVASKMSKAAAGSQDGNLPTLGGFGGAAGLQGAGADVDLDKPVSILDPDYASKMQVRIRTRMAQAQARMAQE